MGDSQSQKRSICSSKPTVVYSRIVITPTVITRFRIKIPKVLLHAQAQFVQQILQLILISFLIDLRYFSFRGHLFEGFLKYTKMLRSIANTDFILNAKEVMRICGNIMYIFISRDII